MKSIWYQVYDRKKNALQGKFTSKEKALELFLSYQKLGIETYITYCTEEEITWGM